ncbi:hypothetical protein JW921_09795, partial [Candidatus Fermentibacterales bacterium]|nr:hypothetical protein [Candidatus Fermentibacterales bacterium]
MIGRAIGRAMPYLLSGGLSLAILILFVIPRSTCHRYNTALELMRRGEHAEALLIIDGLPPEVQLADSLRRVCIGSLAETLDDSLRMYADFWTDGRSRCSLLHELGFRLELPCVGADAGLVAGLDRDGDRVVVIDTGTGQVTASVPVGSSQGYSTVTDLDLSPDGEYLAVGFLDDPAVLLSIEQNRLRHMSPAYP